MKYLLKRSTVFATVLVLSSLALLLTLRTNTHAQADLPTLPIILNLQVLGETGGEDLYRWNEGDTELIRLSTWGFNSELALSPDGQQVAYHSYARVTVDAIRETGGFGGGKGPGNIWVMNTQTSDAYRIADQPADAAFLTDNDKAIIRSKPFWSPDSTKVGWVEFDYPQRGDMLSRLMVYDIPTGTTTTLASDLPMQAGQGAISEGTWVESAIALTNVGAKPDTEEFEFSFGYLIYAPDGTLLNSFQLETSPERRIQNEVFATYQERDVLAVQYRDSAWELTDILTGETMPTPSAPYAYSAFTPGSGMHFTYDEFGQPVFFGDDGEQLAVPRTNHIPAISPDGQAIAFDMMVYREGSSTELPLPEDLNGIYQTLWAPLVWIIPD
jgi:hypothetical protein